MMIFVPTLYGLAGVCAYAALQHGFTAWRRPVERTHLLFAILCLVAALLVVAKAGAYQADSPLALVSLRRWGASFSAVFFAVFPWFVAEYTGVRPRVVLVGLMVFIGSMLAVNLVLPYGIQFVELPALERFTLPWGEQVVDLRVLRRSGWHNAGWLGIFFVFAYSIYACVRQYRSGARRRALTLAFGLALFIAGMSINRIVNYGLVEFPHVAEFGFLFLVAVIHYGLVREQREAERRTQAVLDHVPTAVYVKDLGGRYLLVNRCFGDLLHVPNDSVVGKTDYELFPAEQAETLRVNDRQVLESRRVCEFEEVTDRDGERRTYHSLKYPLVGTDGAPYAICGISIDVTESRNTRKEILELRRQIWHVDRVGHTDAIAASLAHELNQPLTAILSNAQAALRFLDRTPADTEELREILSDIVHDDKRAGAVVSSLRALSRRQEMSQGRTDIAVCADEVLDLLHGEFIQHNIDCTRALETGCVVFADKTLVTQVMLNLVTNALDAMRAQPPEKRHLRVTVSRGAAGEVRVGVRDSGVGIREGKLIEVFEAFYTTKDRGLGIGLAVCRSIVESHGGRIWVERNDDRGVTFFFNLRSERRRRPRP